MKRFGLFGLVLVVSILGACNDNDGGSGFGIPSGQIGEVRMTIGTSPSCVGGANDGGVCSPNSDCSDAFCSKICIGDPGRPLCNTDADCVLTCEFGCDRGIDDGMTCSQDTDCPAGTCTTGLIHDFEGFFTYTGDPFAAPFFTDTDGDGDGFTPAIILDTAPLGTEGEIFVDFLDDVPDCVTVTWGPQETLVVEETCGDPIEATFSFPQ
jgi:hypothetical protein